MIRTFLNNRLISRAASAISKSKTVFVFTGAGISASAGIPTFRDVGGLWTNEDIAFFGSPEAWEVDAGRCWAAYESFRSVVNSAFPTPAHMAVKKLAELKRMVIATTNVDSLHSLSGAPAYEIHGSLANARCKACKNVVELPRRMLQFQPSCTCGGSLRHDVVLWNEEVRYMDIVYRATLGADCLIFIGMSGTVTDTATLAEIAKSKGKTVIEINTAKSTPASPYADFYLQMKSDEALSKLIEKLY